MAVVAAPVAGATAAAAAKSTAATYATAATVAAAAASAGGAVMQGVQASKQAKFQAESDNQRADHERAVASATEDDFRRRQARLESKRTALEGGSGREIGTGTSLIAAEDFSKETELAALRIRTDGLNRATRLDDNAGLLRTAGKNAQIGGFARGGASLLAGAGKGFARYSELKD